MKVSVALLVAVSTAATVNGVALTTGLATASPGCNRDNCLRALLGRPSTIGSADCTSFLQTTVTQFTATITTIVTPAPQMKKRDEVVTVTPSTWPAYAGCSSTVRGDFEGVQTSAGGIKRFASACSCIGATVSTTTTIQATQTASVPQFNIGLTCYNRDSYYLFVQNGVLRAHDFNSLEPPPAVFTFDSDNNLLVDGVIIEINIASDPSKLYNGTADSPVSCFFEPGSPYFYPSQNCVAGGIERYFYIPGSGPGIWDLFLGTADSQCIPVAALL